MKMNEIYPSKYLKADDLQGREVRVTMQAVELEKIGDDNKPVLYFKGKDKGVVLNKTNAGTISMAYGDDTDDWFDQPLILFSVMVDFQGKVAPAIRCRVPTAKDNRTAAPAKREDPISSGPIDPPRRVTGGVSDNMQMDDDSIPF
jgi:arabinogalactan endo-1,4-beta-galactosidase